MELPGTRAKIASIAIFIFSLGLGIAILFIPVNTERIAPLGYFGVFIITLLGAMTLFIPGPTMVVAFLIGARFNPFLVGLFAGLGSAIGETTGYTTGYATRALINIDTEKDTWYARTLRWMMKRPFMTLFIFSAIPNPITDISGLVAGRMKYPYILFLLATFFGKTIRFGRSAFLGADLGSYFIHPR